MSDDHDNSRLPEMPKTRPVYLTAQQAAPLAGWSRPTMAKRLPVPPDAWYLGPNGQCWPLWLRSTLEAYRAERQGSSE